MTLHPGPGPHDTPAVFPSAEDVAAMLVLTKGGELRTAFQDADGNEAQATFSSGHPFAMLVAAEFARAIVPEGKSVPRSISGTFEHHRGFYLHWMGWLPLPAESGFKALRVGYYSAASPDQRLLLVAVARAVPHGGPAVFTVKVGEPLPRVVADAWSEQTPVPELEEARLAAYAALLDAIDRILPPAEGASAPRTP